MLMRHLVAVVLFTTIPVATSTVAAEETAVALTATVYTGAGDAPSDLMSGLLDLLQVEMSLQPDVVIVERRQIDLALHELALSADLNGNADSRLQLGKITSADFIVTLELKAPDESVAAASVLIRIVESQTGVIRGVSAATIDDGRIDQAATQIANYFRIVKSHPAQTPITVAVSPFECKGRFERLRPLELGLRDMFTSRLTLWSDTLAQQEYQAEAADQASRFHVVQRSGMKALLAELELIQSALVDRSRLPKTLPSRAAAFLVRGSVDETTRDGEFRIVVAGQLVNAASDSIVKEFEFTTTPEDLEANLGHGVDVFAGYLANSESAVRVGAARLRELNETQESYEAVLPDLRRFRRRNPIYFGYTDFALDGKPSGPPVVAADSVLGQSLLKKSIDRLEVATFIKPDNMQAAYALGYCFSFHIDGIWQPERADELLRKVGTAAEESALRAEALKLLAEVSFHHWKGRPNSKMLATAAEQVAYALINTPEKHRDEMWARMIELFQRTLSHADDPKMLADLAEFCRSQAAIKNSPHRGQMATFAVEVSERLRVVQADPSSSATMELEKLLNGDDLAAKEMAARKLGGMLRSKRQYAEAAAIYVKAADALATSGSESNRFKANNLRFHAAKSLRTGGDFQSARALLESFSPVSPTSLNAGYRAVELAQCYAHDGETERARDLLIHAAENVWSLTGNSNIETLIAEYGGVPLREDREIDVEYIKGPRGESLRGNLIADGTTLLFAGQKEGSQYGIRSYDTLTGLIAFEPTEFDEVNSLKLNNNRLWAATDSGLWYREQLGSAWTAITTTNGLPDDRVDAITFVGDVVYAGVGTRGAGGLVRIDPDGTVTVQTGDDAPQSVVYSLAAFGDRLVAATQPVVHELDLKTGVWLKNRGYIRLFEGRKGIWSSMPGRELAPYGADTETAEHYQPTWFNAYGKSGYGVSSVIEKHGQIWLCGGPWRHFASSGFYRFDPRTRDFVMYGPRDGFRADGGYSVSSGVAIGDDFWLMTSDGLARVTPRPEVFEAKTPANIRHTLFLQTVKALEIRYDDTLKALDLNSKPILQRTAYRDGKRVDSELYVFTDRLNAPRMVVNASLRKQGNLFLEVTSLSEEPLWGKLPRNDKWRADNGGSGVHLASVQPSAEAELGGLDSVMLEVANSITVELKIKTWNKSPLQPEPLYRFEAPQAGIARGGMFMFGSDNDADAVLLVWQSTETRQWHWLAGASTSLPLRCTVDSEVVWDKVGYWSNLKNSNDVYIEVMASEHPDLVEDEKAR